MSGTAPRIRQDRVRRSFDRVAPMFATNDFLYREISRRMEERLDVVRIAPDKILDAGCGLGVDRLVLQKRYPQAAWFGLDQSVQMLRHGQEAERAALGFMRRLFHVGRRAQCLRVAGSLDALPVKGQSIDLIWSNAALHWIDQLPETLAEFHRVLRISGLLTFSLFGPDTLKELRQAIRAASVLFGGVNANRVHDFVDMHDVGDMLVHAGFSDPVMDMEILTLTYADPRQMLRELQRAGSIGAQGVSVRGLVTPRFWKAVFEHWPRDVQGRYPLTFELIQGHAWKAAPRQHEDGRAVVNFMPRPGKSIRD
jgi:malonyl-CoA O-methyltransferase